MLVVIFFQWEESYYFIRNWPFLAFSNSIFWKSCYTYWDSFKIARIGSIRRQMNNIFGYAWIKFLTLNTNIILTFLNNSIYISFSCLFTKWIIYWMRSWVLNAPNSSSLCILTSTDVLFVLLGADGMDKQLLGISSSKDKNGRRVNGSFSVLISRFNVRKIFWPMVDAHNSVLAYFKSKSIGIAFNHLLRCLSSFLEGNLNTCSNSF